MLTQVPGEDSSSSTQVLEEGLAALPETSVSASTFTRNSIVSIGRLLLSTLIALLVPAYLTHKLPVATYGAWILVLQMSAYVGYLDFGVQTGISKYVAEFEARRDVRGASMRASAGLAIMLATSVLGLLLTLGVAWRVPQLFKDMPPTLYHDVRISLLLVGFSLSFGLIASICGAIFLGLQRFTVPMVLSLINRVLFTVAILVAVRLHSSLALMGAVVAGVHVSTGLLQVVAWRRWAGHIRLSLRRLDYTVVRQMVGYCGSLAIWSAGMLCVSGLDLTLVGRYNFANTAFYSVALLPTNFMLAILGAAVGPLMPAASARNVHGGAAAMGDMLSRATRYSSTLLVLAALPLLVGGYVILRIWVGQTYADHAIPYLRILVVANVIRNLCLPYSSMLVATEKQKVAILGASAEAVVNLGASLILVQRIGAIGVAYGTLLGSVVSVLMHFAVSMHYTRATLAVTRRSLLFSGMLRPLAVALPSLLLMPRWLVTGYPEMNAGVWLLWGASTLLIAWFVSINGRERTRLLSFAQRRLASAGL